MIVIERGYVNVEEKLDKAYNKFLCKAKTYDKAEWVQGYPTFREDLTDENGKPEAKVQSYISKVLDESTIDIVLVIPDTLCKIIPGVFDMNGNPIFVDDYLEERVTESQTSDKNDNPIKFYKPQRVRAVEIISGFVFLRDKNDGNSDRVVPIDTISHSYVVVGNEWDSLRIMDNNPDNITES